MTITCALIQTVEKIAGETGKVRIITKERVTELIMSAGACTACIYENGEATFKEFGPVIFASGGFGADFTNNSLLALKDRFFCTSDRTQTASDGEPESLFSSQSRCLSRVSLHCDGAEPNEAVVDQARKSDSGSESLFSCNSWLVDSLCTATELSAVKP